MDGIGNRKLRADTNTKQDDDDDMEEEKFDIEMVTAGNAYRYTFCLHFFTLFCLDFRFLIRSQEQHCSRVQ